MSVVIVIPARLASSRLPKKMLLADTGWPLIRHTYEQAKKVKGVDDILIATDNHEIEEVVKGFGAKVVMTDPSHPTGTDRLAEVAVKYLQGVDIIVNVQGDEPELAPEKIEHLITLFHATDPDLGTLVTPFPSELRQGKGSPLDPDCVKAVLGCAIQSEKQNVLGYEALYFSRSLIPYVQSEKGNVAHPENYYHHLGVYCYRPDFLISFVKLPRGRLEEMENLEQLRALEHGYRVVAGVVSSTLPGINTQSDYNEFVHRWKLSEPTYAGVKAEVNFIS